MKQLFNIFLAVIMPLPLFAGSYIYSVGPEKMPDSIATIVAPFEMPQLQRPEFHGQTVTVEMNTDMNTRNIQSAIDNISQAGGGTVVIPAGEWQTGRIELKSHVNLHLSEGCVLRFSGEIKDYLPVVFTRDEGIEIYSLGAFIYAHDAEHIALTGRGHIVGPSTNCEIYQNNKEKALNIEVIVKNGEMALKDRIFDGKKNNGEVFLPKTIAPINCKNVLIEGVTLEQGLYWNVVPQYCENVIIRGVTVRSFGHGRTDGIDVESSKNVLIEYCSLDCQDDTYTMKSGRGVDGVKIGRPTENVVVRHCLSLRGAGGIVCGTEVAGGIKNVYCHDCVFDGTDQAFRFKSRRTRGGGIENIFVERVQANVKHAAFYCDLLGETKWMGKLAQRFPVPPKTKYTPYFHDISVHDVTIDGCKELVSFTGQPELPVKNVFFGNATVKCQRIGHVQDVTGFAMKDVKIESTDSILTLDGCSVVNIFGVNSLTHQKPVKVVQKGEPSSYISVQEVPMQPITYHSVRPGQVWLDTDGKPIQAHGFQICNIDGTYYWYGENKADALLGTNRMFGGVRCYSSKDFYNWKDEGLILAPDTVNPMSPIHYSQKLERPHIIKNPRNGKYVLWAKSQAEDGYFAIFQADNFMGPYTFIRNLQPEGYGVGDFDMYVDEQTGKGYVWFERPHWELICAELTDDFFNVTDVYSNHFVGQKPPYTREAPAHFFTNGKHYLFTSGTTGYTSNPSEVAVFDDYHGDYHILGDPHVADSCASSFNSQITGVIKIPGTETWVALADRWEPHTTGTDFSRRTVEAKKGAYANYQPQPQKPVGTEPKVENRRYKLVDMAHAVYHAGYVFLPITFEDGIPKIHWQEEWQTAAPQHCLSYGFDHPQDSARTKVWWFHGETIGTHEGITADLEAFKEQGVGGVVYYDQVHGNGEGAFKVFSPEWWDELIFSSKEAKRIGLDFEVNASNGYVAGGKWITPDKSMQRLAYSEKIIEGGGDMDFLMPGVSAPHGWMKNVALIALPYDEQLMGDSRNILSADSVWKLTDPTETKVIDIDFGKPFTARHITYKVGARGKARTSSMQVPPFSPRVGDMVKGQQTTWDFFGCGYRVLPPIGELQVSDDGINYQTVCQLRPKYQNLGGVKEQTVSFPATNGRYFRIHLHDWATTNKADQKLTFGNVVLSARASVDAWQEKASLVSEIIDSDNTPSYAANELVDVARAIDLSDMMDESGHVTWRNAPKGKWLLMRFVSVSTGGHTKHGRAEVLGLECDKLSVEGARLQWQSYVKPIIDSIRANNGYLIGVTMDSHEAGPQNWTIGFEKEFQRLRGYDMKKYLPVMAGLVVESAETSGKFLLDLRRTINDLITDKYFGEFNRLCLAEGLMLTAQAVGGALCMAGDAISVKKQVDKPQAEFWGYQTEGNYDIKDCSSAAHLYGKQIASGEAYTDITYKESLADIKNLADYAYCFGINELVVCAVAYQPWVRQSGEKLKISTANGRQYVLNRLNTYWPMSRPFWDYQARCSWVLRQGKPVSDICLYLGDNIPVRILSHKLPELPQGYDFDAFTADALLNRMTVKDGRIVLPDGVSYRMMILPIDGRLSDIARERIELFKSQGIPVYDPQTDQLSLEDAIQKAGLIPDVYAPSAAHLYFCHRQTADEDIYFINNHSDKTVSDCFRFHATATSAELWNPVDGQRLPLVIHQQGESTAIDLTLAPRESYFIVLSRSAKSDVAVQKDSKPVNVQVLDCSWKVTFYSAMGGPEKPVIFDELGDWTKNEDPRIKYFSGTALAQTTFKIDKLKQGANYSLDIPLLHTAAKVIVNGQSAGILWCSPYSIDITKFIKKGKNQLELRIANSLWNRLVGDANLSEQDRIVWQTHPLASATDQLVPSGLADKITIKER